MTGASVAITTGAAVGLALANGVGVADGTGVASRATRFWLAARLFDDVVVVVRLKERPMLAELLLDNTTGLAKTVPAGITVPLASLTEMATG
jgi:hypothetical protein